MDRKLLAALVVAWMIVLRAAPTLAAPAGGASAVWLVEFYTSEACSSCLAADAAFPRLAAEPGVIALGFHVAYWNYLGWTDRFALPVADQRQWDYARHWRKSEVFTPEMVINGTISGVGDNAAEIGSLMRQAKPLPRIDLALDQGKIVATIPAVPHPAGAAVWIVTFDRSRTVAIDHGENTGHVIHEVDIVRFAQPVAILDKAPKRITIALPRLRADDGVVSFVQEPKGGRVTAAGRMFPDQPPPAPQPAPP